MYDNCKSTHFWVYPLKWIVQRPASHSFFGCHFPVLSDAIFVFVRCRFSNCFIPFTPVRPIMTRPHFYVLIFYFFTCQQHSSDSQAGTMRVYPCAIVSIYACMFIRVYIRIYANVYEYVYMYIRAYAFVYLNLFFLSSQRVKACAITYPH